MQIRDRSAGNAGPGSPQRLFALTGATGLVGVHVALECLRRGHRVVAIVRPRPDAGPQARVRKILGLYPGFHAEIRSFASLHAVAGDILRPACGLAEADAAFLADNLNGLIHCAGNVSFDARAARETLVTNVAGVRNALDLAAALRCRRFVHVSTAYVDRLEKGLPPRTEYERSKWEAEGIVREFAAQRGLDARIVRPTIVTGDRIHGFTPTYHGIYPFFRFAASLRQDNLPVDIPSWIRRGFTLDARVNLVPADYVAAVVCAVAEASDPPTQVFNLTNPTPWPFGDLLQVVFGHFGISLDHLAVSAYKEAASSPAMRRADMLLETYSPYFNADLALDSASVRRLADARGISPLRNDPDWIRALLRWSVRMNWQEAG